jgi:hypothetical protein
MNIFSYWLSYLQTKTKDPLVTNYLADQKITSDIDFFITDPYGVKRKYKVTDEEIINLSGGFPTTKFVDGYFRAFSVNEDVFKVEVMYDFGADQTGTPRGGRVLRTIDFLKRQIRNDEVQLQIKNTGFGTKLFINQVNAARRQGFITFSMQAAGGVDYYPITSWDGYKVWGKYGYIMGPYHQRKFDFWRIGKNIKQKTLNELYWQNKEKYSLWESTGFSWDGFFDLRDGSLSMYYLKLYLLSKRINVKLNPFRSP